MVTHEYAQRTRLSHTPNLHHSSATHCAASASPHQERPVTQWLRPLPCGPPHWQVAPRFGGSGALEPLAAGRAQEPCRAVRGISQTLLLSPSRPCLVSPGKTPHTSIVCHILGHNLLPLKCAIKFATITVFLSTKLSLSTHQAAEETVSLFRSFLKVCSGAMVRFYDPQSPFPRPVHVPKPPSEEGNELSTHEGSPCVTVGECVNM